MRLGDQRSQYEHMQILEGATLALIATIYFWRNGYVDHLQEMEYNAAGDKYKIKKGGTEVVQFPGRLSMSNKMMFM